MKHMTFNQSNTTYNEEIYNIITNEVKTGGFVISRADCNNRIK
jgi:hypothetical protein